MHLKAFEVIKHYRKELVFEHYSKIIKDFKDYEKITKVKMLEAIYKVYEDPKNIIDICTTRELKYLQMSIDGKKEINDAKYMWEKTNLANKLICYRVDGTVYDELYDNVKLALKEVNWEEAKRKDELNELMVSFCKVQGSCLLYPLINMASIWLEISDKEIFDHTIYNRVFNYYVYVIHEDIPNIGDNMPVAIYDDYFDLIDELEERRVKQNYSKMPNLKLEDYKSLFYNDFNMNNETIKKFYTELQSLPFVPFRTISLIQEYVLLDLDRQGLKDYIASIPALKGYDLTDFLELMDDAMDEMPSGALNGLTPNELKTLKKEEVFYVLNKTLNYVRQENACFNKKDSKQFFKLYFALLDYTNQKYKIKDKFKIYKQKDMKVEEVLPIINKFWKDKDSLIDEFCKINPYKFNDEEIDIIKEFKKGFRDIFIIVKFDPEYTMLTNSEKAFMVKGLNENIDNIIPYESLPMLAITSLLPYKGKIVYDGIIASSSIEFDIEIKKAMENDATKLMKYYHL